MQFSREKESFMKLILSCMGNKNLNFKFKATLIKFLSEKSERDKNGCM